MYENDGFHPYEDNNDAQNRYEAQSSETSGNQWQQPLYQMPQQPEHTQPKKKHTAGRVVALALCCSLLGGAVGAGAMAEKQGNGKDYYKTILTHYYTGTKVEKMY